MMLGVVLFDGTLNNRLNVPEGGRQTIVAHLYERLQGNPSIEFIKYYPGVGTQSLPIRAAIDAATGYTLKETAERAADKVIVSIEKMRKATPEIDVRLLVSGFSRGGAAARHFMNVLEQRWEDEVIRGTPPHFYAVIFDTVATGQREALSLQVPALADMFYHFTSINERRVFFKPIFDIPQSTEYSRITTFRMPGAHSDVGASYSAGVGLEYLANVDALLSGMGLLPQQCFTVEGDARSQGKNDSRWLLEQGLGIGAPDTKDEPSYRTSFHLHAEPLPINFWPEWNRRMLSLESWVHRITAALWTAR
ncbi:DUF2235 domain-containing protein [Chromohalobacter sp. 11-W]|uniref:phospholipase effector Tle1 domain-containing protein n=1 Tax=Chromohalobacter sp. 11-W TaxID=2994061 RepID=UPI002468A63B|nr:DUF2235 domain-containing protein [Chromohalobacter sp. 11-W]